jgi:hypothetical protein
MLRLLTILAMSFIAFVHDGAVAQVSIDRLPDGRPVAGWAVEIVPADMNQRVTDYFAAAGVQRVSLPGGEISWGSPALGGTQVVHNGRAFLRISTVGRYNFIMNMDQGPPGAIHCGGYLRVGGADVVRIGLKELRGFDHFALMANRALDLNPGIYRAEYVFFCPPWTGLKATRYSVRWRDESDAAPRDFSATELFHLER